MDIFNKIYTEEINQNKTKKFRIEEKDGRVRIINPQFNPEKAAPDIYSYVPTKTTPYLGKSPEDKKRAIKFYNYMTKPRKAYSQLSDRQQRKINKFFDKMLEKGINFEYFDQSMMQNLLYEISNPEHIKKLYHAGVDMQKALKIGYSSNYSKFIWQGIEHLDVEQIFDLPSSVLTALIETRKDLKISTQEFDEFFVNHRRYSSISHAFNELLEYGQISVTFEQLDTMKYYICRIFCDLSCYPAICELYDYGVQTGRIAGENASEKYSTSKQLSGTKQISKSEAQDKIDDLFEAAQNAVE